MQVRCKMKVDAIEASKAHDGQILKTIKMTPVYGDSDENKKFWQWTPSGSIHIGVLNKQASDSFELGAEYFVDFTPAKEPGPSEPAK